MASPLPTPPYIELHTHSGYSFLDGASHPEELVLQARALGYPALALTDHDALYGAMEFARAAQEAGLQAITGAEVTVRECGIPGEVDTDRDDRGHYPIVASSSRPGEPAGHFHLTLLVETPRGYANLSRLLTLAHRTSPRGTPSLPLESLLQRNEGLILLSGCRRSPLLHALGDSAASGETFARRLLVAFGPDRLFVELQENRVRNDAGRNRKLARLADRLEIPVVATGNVHYHRRERHRLQDVLAAIRHRATLDGSHALRRPNAEFHLAPPEEMVRRFGSRPDALANTLRIAERCAAFDLTSDLGYRFPDFEGSEGGSAMEVLTAVTRAAMEERYPKASGCSLRERERRAEAERRLEQELALVERHGLGGFFLVYRDVMELAREIGARVRGSAPRATSGLPPGRGRGSSVSSIICYLIGLSHVDPVEAKLFLGRFLNEAMGSVPDIDLDFPRDIREELILAVYEKYGHDHAGLVAIFPTYRLRSAVREVGKVLDLPPGDLEKIAKVAEHRSATGLREELSVLPEFREKVESPLWTHFLERVEEIAGLPRHISQHVGGMIISSRPLLEIVPLEPAAMEGRFLCHWDKDSCDDAGFIKIDFLALGMLSLVEEAVDLIAERGTARRPPPPGTQPIPLSGDAPDLSRIDLQDPAVYRRIQAGDTVGIFQVESRAQIQMLQRTLPSNLEELAVQVAIVRPGPIVGGAVNPYVRRREAQRADPAFRVPYDHPLLESALEETLGVVIYQDQVLQVCRDLAGFTDGQAESLRRAMSRKRSKEAMRAQWEAFREGACAREVPEETAKSVFKQVVAFSEFGFPKSHAAAFALLAYQSAWLRHYFPTEYYVALFNNQPMGFYSLDALGRDARRNGIRIRLPDLNRSEVTCTAEGADLRVGLGFVRGWGSEIAARVVEERERAGPYRSLVDFLRRTPAALRRPAVENLIWVGGLDGLGLTRRELLWQTGLWLGPEEERTRASGRIDDPQLPIELDDPDTGRPFSDLDDQGRMIAEYRMLRFSTALHPLGLIRDRLPAGTLASDRLPGLPEGAIVTLAGLVIARQRPQTAKGYVFVLMEDEHGHVNVIVKPKIYEHCRSAVRMEPFLRIRGRLQRDGTVLNVIALEVEPLQVGDAASDGSRGRPAIGGGEIPRERGPPSDTADPFAYLTALRQNPPGVKSFG